VGTEGAWEGLRGLLQRVPEGVPSAFEPGATRYLQELRQWSRAGRLTGYRGDEGRIRELLGASLLLLIAVPELAGPLADVGSGPGVPGLIIKLARPTWAVTLIEGRRRPANFLRHVVRALDLADVTVVEARAEAPAIRARLAHRFHAVTIRAVAPVAEAVALALPLVNPRGRLVVGVGPREARAEQWGTVREADGAPLLGRRRFVVVSGCPPWPGDAVPRGT